MKQVNSENGLLAGCASCILGRNFVKETPNLFYNKIPFSIESEAVVQMCSVEQQLLKFHRKVFGTSLPESVT